MPGCRPVLPVSPGATPEAGEPGASCFLMGAIPPGEAPSLKPGTVPLQVQTRGSFLAPPLPPSSALNEPSCSEPSQPTGSEPHPASRGTPSSSQRVWLWLPKSTILSPWASVASSVEWENSALASSAQCRDYFS